MLFIDGNHAIALGAIHAGCRFFAAYPITPATTLLSSMLDMLPPEGGIVLQGEDEIASIGYCLGASMAGIKAMTATSGPGISLYSENISFAIAGEIPVVIVDVMRQGPSTGAATRSADGDIMFLRWGNSGGLPVIVLAPVDVRDCFTLTIHAFNLAEKYRCPVFLAINKEIGMTRETFDLETIEKPTQINRTLHASGPFLPFITDAQKDVPPFLPIGGQVPIRQTSSTHGPDGFITTDPQEIQAGVERLKRKIESQISSFSFYDQERNENAGTLLIAYGVTARAARTACMNLLQDHGIPVSLLVPKTLWPVPEQLFLNAARNMKNILLLEMNLGQYIHEVRRVLSNQKVDFFGKMSGELITPKEIVKEVIRAQSA